MVQFEARLIVYDLSKVLNRSCGILQASTLWSVYVVCGEATLQHSSPTLSLPAITFYMTSSSSSLHSC